MVDMQSVEWLTPHALATLAVREMRYEDTTDKGRE